MCNPIEIMTFIQCQMSKALADSNHQWRSIDKIMLVRTLYNCLLAYWEWSLNLNKLIFPNFQNVSSAPLKTVDSLAQLCETLWPSVQLANAKWNASKPLSSHAERSPLGKATQISYLLAILFHNIFCIHPRSLRYGPKTLGSIIDNCQLSDWPVRDMDKERHLIQDNAFEVYERASYGHGCEIQQITDDKHKKCESRIHNNHKHFSSQLNPLIIISTVCLPVCYLGYGSPAKLMASAVKKVLTVPTELECKNECVRLRETTAFNCMSFSFG